MSAQFKKITTPIIEGTGTKEGPVARELMAQDSLPLSVAMQSKGNYMPEPKPIDFSRYYSREFAAQEREKVWNKSWQFVCREEEVPNIGDRYTYDVGTNSYFVVRSAECEFKAFYNFCRHRGNRLSFERSRGSSIRCKFHGWEWNLDGSLKHLPHDWDFPHVDKQDYGLVECKIGRWGGFIFINPDAAAAPLEKSLGVLPQHFAHWQPEQRFVALHAKKLVKANWKLVAEAFFESYHAPVTHPQSSPFAADCQVQYDIWDDGDSHISRLIGPTAIPSGTAPESATAEDAVMMVAGFLVGNQSEAERKASLEQLKGKGRVGLAALRRQQLQQQYGREFTLSDVEMIDSIQYFMFPNFFPWMGEFLPLVYQFLPYGDDPEMCAAHTRLLLPLPAAGRPPAAKMKQLGFDDTFEAIKEWADIGIVFDQDYLNLPDIQRGLRASAGSGKGYATPARYQESRITHFHEVIDRMINR
jgi:phenylpropionate dioxygenase-like ring-hydroxylating dioxygenase large terminal subunit